ncbi:MAG TPA: serine/threonine-protein kinase, partial [Gemmatimonadaceae bacterium]
MSDPLHERVVAALGDQYELLGEIGRGGMAVVYRARDRRLDRPVALKILPPELAHDPAIRTRFAREAHTAAQLSHPHIVPIHDVGDREGVAYFVMGLVTGGNLAALLAREPKLPIPEVRRLLCEIADALAYAHTRGVIHRDIKPDNILLDRDSGRAMVTDFGIARAMEAGGRLTATGIAVGTPTYMSPEQAVGEREVDGRSDLYSLGVIGYQMLTGRVPFSASNSMALLLKHVTERPRPLSELRPDTPRAIREAIERALLKSPEDRWPTAAAFREALLEEASPTWRAEPREPVRYTSPRPESVRRERAPRRGGRVPAVRDVQDPPAAAAPASSIVLVPEHLQALTKEQRDDLRLWRGRVHLLDRIKAARWHALATLSAWFGSMIGW